MAEYMKNLENVTQDPGDDVYDGKGKGKQRFTGRRIFGTKDYIDGVPLAAMDTMSDDEIILLGTKAKIFPAPDYEDFSKRIGYEQAWNLKQVHNAVRKDCKDYPSIAREYAETAAALKAAVDAVETPEDWDALVSDIMSGTYNRAFRSGFSLTGEADARQKGFLMTKRETYLWQAENRLLLRPLSDFTKKERAYSFSSEGETRGLAYDWGIQYFRGFDPDIEDGWVLADGTSVIAQGGRDELEEIMAEKVLAYAESWLAEDAARAERRKAKAAAARKKKKKVKAPAPNAIVREGGEVWRKGGASVPTAVYTGTFALTGTLKSAAYSAKQLDRVINLDYDCMADLCQLLRIGPESIGQGKLAVSFGARGCGKAASGFYSPEEKAIFIPKKEGGAKAHEFFHFTDHMVGLALGGFDLASKTMWPAQIEDEFPAFAELIRFARSSDFRRHGQKLDSIEGRRKAYYGAMHELLARAFQCFVQDRMDESGLVNTSLNHTGDFQVEGPGGEKIFGFPQGAEREKFNGLFAAVVEELVEKGIFAPWRGTGAMKYDPPGSRKPKARPSKREQGKPVTGTQVSFMEMIAG